MKPRRIALIALTGTALLLWGTGGAGAHRPSPNTRIVFHGFNSVRSVRPDGGGARTLASFPGGGIHPITDVIDVAASVNGRRVAAVTQKLASAGPGSVLVNRIFILSGDGGKQTAQFPPFVSDGVNSIAMSSDGREIAFPKDGDIYVAKVGATAMRRVTTGGQAKHPAFSRDRKKLVFERNTSGNQDVYVVRTSGGAATRLTHQSGGDESNPSFSPDGRFIAYAEDVTNSNGRTGQLHVMRADGSGDHSIATTGTGEDAAPSFSPGGGSIVYVGITGGRFRLFTIRVNGTHRKLVNGHLGAKDPQWTRLP